MTFSDDDGRTWANPRDVKVEVMDPAWTWYAFGPGMHFSWRRAGC